MYLNMLYSVWGVLTRRIYHLLGKAWVNYEWFYITFPSNKFFFAKANSMFSCDVTEGQTFIKNQVDLREGKTDFSQKLSSRQKQFSRDLAPVSQHICHIANRTTFFHQTPQRTRFFLKTVYSYSYKYRYWTKMFNKYL